MNRQTKRLLILSVFIWIIANLHHPVTPTHFNNLSLPDHVFGTSYAVMVFAIFVTAPIWGSLGDQGYRREILILVTLVYGIIQIAFGYATSIREIMILRALGGFAASGFHVGLMSALVDVNNIHDRKEVMANYSAISSISQAIGFLIGGYIGYLPSSWVFIIQGTSMIIVSIGIKLFIETTNSHFREDRLKRPSFIWDLFRDIKSANGSFTSWTLIFLAITFFTGISYSSYNNAFNYYLKAEMNLKPIFNGVWKALIGIIGLVANLTVNIWLIKRTDTKKSIIFLIGINFISALLAFRTKSIYLFFIYSFLFFTIYIIQTPILQAFAVEGNSKDAGLMSGVFNASKSLGEMVGSSSAGFAYSINSRLPFLIGALACLASLFLSFLNRKLEKIK